MIKALNTAATGMAAQESNVNNIANNIANANTTGFKKSRTEFEDLLYQTVTEAGSRSSANTRYNVGTQVGSGAKVSATRKDMEVGAPMITNNPFDFMIKGEGFFGIVLPDGQLTFSRDGAFNLDAQGNLVTKKGHKIFPGITVPPGTRHINVTDDGKLEAYGKNQAEPQIAGTIPLFTFINPSGLRAIGGNLLKDTQASGNPNQITAGTSNAGLIQQGTLEASNVSIMNEMTNLIKAQRAYEMNSKVMGISDQMLQTVNNIR